MKLIFLLGPPAVGKMTIGQELVKKLDFTLFHNHHSIELALDLFYHGSPEFKAINEGIRQLVFKTCAKSKNLKGLIFTLVMDFDLQEDWDYVDKVKAIFHPYGWEFYFVELAAPLAIRLERNKTPNRLKHKASKRAIEKSEQGMIQMDQKHQLNSMDGTFPHKNYLRIDNSKLTAVATAQLIIQHFEF